MKLDPFLNIELSSPSLMATEKVLLVLIFSSYGISN